MLITKHEEVTKQGFCKILWRKLCPRESLLLQFIHSVGWGGGECLFELIGRRRGWALIRGWAPINFFCLSDGRLFKVGANSRLDAYSNKYGNCFGQNLSKTVQVTTKQTMQRRQQWVQVYLLHFISPVWQKCSRCCSHWWLHVFDWLCPLP